MASTRVTPVLLVISAPSGAGKTTVSNGLLATTPGLTRVVTCTTRAPRGGERDGVEYHFLDPATFERRVAAGEFLEHARVYGNRYGTLEASVVERLREGADVLLSVDVQGAESIHRAAAENSTIGRSLASVFLMPPSESELERRLRGRDEDDAETIGCRLAEARREMEQWSRFRYVVVSASRDDDLAALRSILSAERLRVDRLEALHVD